MKAMQETLQKAYEARMGLIAQQQETELVKEEIDSIEELAAPWKLWKSRWYEEEKMVEKHTGDSYETLRNIPSGNLT